MNNITELATIIHTMNNKTFPSIFDVIKNISLHIGEYKWSARSNDFSGWLMCDGRALSNADYPDLYEVIGTTFGSDDEGTFKLPDMRGRVMGCAGQGDGLTDRVFGTMLGAETHTLNSNEMPSHTHSATSSNAGGHNHGGWTNTEGLHSHTVNDPGHTHTQTTTNDDFNNSGTNPPGFTADSAGSITWNNINTGFTNITIGSNGSHAHTISTDGVHSHAITVLSTGGGQPHNNMQPTAFAGNCFIFAGLKLAHTVA